MVKTTLVARPLLTIDKPRNVTPVERDGKIYLHITKCKYLGSGRTLDEAIADANLRTFATGYLVSTKGGK